MIRGAHSDGHAASVDRRSPPKVERHRHNPATTNWQSQAVWRALCFIDDTTGLRHPTTHRRHVDRCKLAHGKSASVRVVSAEALVVRDSTSIVGIGTTHVRRLIVCATRSSIKSNKSRVWMIVNGACRASLCRGACRTVSVSTGSLK